MIVDDITWKQLIWYGHVERMDPTRLPKIMIHWKPEGRRKTRSSLENLERWNIYSHEWKRSKNGQIEQSKAMEYESWKALSDVLKLRNIYTNIILQYVDHLYTDGLKLIFNGYYWNLSSV